MGRQVEKKSFGVGIIGCGLIGSKRAANIGNRGKIITCYDTNKSRANALATDYSVSASQSIDELLSREDLDLVIISTLHDSLSSISESAINKGKHVLVEKPGARNLSEIQNLIRVSDKSKCKVRVGLNHRYHPAFVKAKSIVESGALGEIMFIRGRYGHGGRLGYEKEWRANPEISGGGELLDQGPHLIDLSRWFLGDFTEVEGHVCNLFWDMPVDDNAFLMLKNDNRNIAFLHVSCTEWKNTFSFEIYGQLGKLDVFGLGGSYGVEKLTHYKMLPEMGPPDTTSWEFPRGDSSWRLEIEEFFDDITIDRKTNPGLEDALEVHKIIDLLYRNSNYVDRS